MDGITIFLRRQGQNIRIKVVVIGPSVGSADPIIAVFLLKNKSIRNSRTVNFAVLNFSYFLSGHFLFPLKKF